MGMGVIQLGDLAEYRAVYLWAGIYKNINAYGSKRSGFIDIYKYSGKLK
jgi:hypothetical protein